MKYVKDQLQVELDKFIGHSIENVYYQSVVEGYPHHDQLEQCIHEVPLFGVQFHLNDGSMMDVHSWDYWPNSAHGGVISRRSKRNNSDCLPNRIENEAWSEFRNSRVVKCEIIEHTYRSKKVDYVIPLGISLLFECNKKIYLFDVGVDDYKEDVDMYELIWSYDEITIFFCEKEVLRHGLPSN